jgi:tRNA-Thr(GGU) m(6)t(6)A37 methyltransferase TsaA
LEPCSLLASALRQVLFRPIAIVHSPFVWREEAPRQAGLGSNTGQIVLLPGYQNAIKDLAGFDHLWVLAWFHRSEGWKEQIIPPRDKVKRGVLATRSPDRPNPIGLSCVRLLSVRGRTLSIADHDLLDGTPILDLKPYLNAYDSHPNASTGWVGNLQDPGPDHRPPANDWQPKRKRLS